MLLGIFKNHVLKKVSRARLLTAGPSYLHNSPCEYVSHRIRLMIVVGEGGEKAVRIVIAITWPEHIYDGCGKLGNLCRCHLRSLNAIHSGRENLGVYRSHLHLNGGRHMLQFPELQLGFFPTFVQGAAHACSPRG